MRTKIYILIIGVLFLNTWMVSVGWSQNEQVKGYYDPMNDWFVFEWDRPTYGKTTTIYDPPNKVKPVIRGKVEFNEKEQEYIYNYEVTNLDGAMQSIDDIFIKHLAPVYGVKVPSPEGDWYSDEYERKSAWQWAKTGGTPPGILAGQTVRGLSFKSKGLPTILNAALTGVERAVYSPPGDYDTDEVEESFERMYNKLKEQYPEKFVHVIKKILGPIMPPADFKPIDFLNYIIELKHQAASLGWIKNKGIEQSLDAKLDNAKKKIEQGNTTAAKNILNAFINEVEAQKDKHLTSEAYALLKYNVQYLIGRL